MRTGSTRARWLVGLCLGVWLGGCALPRGHREGYVIPGARTLNPQMTVVVEENSLAARAGVHGGDQIQGVNGVEVHSAEDFQKQLNALKVGDTVRIKVLRQEIKDGKLLAVSSTVETVVQDSDVAESSNYLVWGYEKAGGKFRRRWLHLGLVAFGDWSGRMTDEHLLKTWINVDVLPEYALRYLALIGFYLPSTILIGQDGHIDTIMPHLNYPTLFFGRHESGGRAFALSLLACGKDQFNDFYSLWPLGGYHKISNQKRMVYLTPLNTLSFGESKNGFSLAGLVRSGPGKFFCALPFYFYQGDADT